MPDDGVLPTLTPAPLATEEKSECGKEPPVAEKIPGTGPGTCLVCLEDCEDVVGAAWLHPPIHEAGAGVANRVGDCPVSACLACLKTYFTVRKINL